MGVCAQGRNYQKRKGGRDHSIEITNERCVHLGTVETKGSKVRTDSNNDSNAQDDDRCSEKETRLCNLKTKAQGEKRTDKNYGRQRCRSKKAQTGCSARTGRKGKQGQYAPRDRKGQPLVLPIRRKRTNPST